MTIINCSLIFEQRGCCYHWHCWKHIWKVVFEYRRNTFALDSVSPGASLGLARGPRTTMHCKRRMCSGLAIFLLTAALIVVYMQMNHYNFIVHTDSTHIKELLSESNQTFTTVPPVSPRACSCTKCISEKGVSAWFDKRFNSSAQPLLTAKDDNLPQPALSWWLVSRLCFHRHQITVNLQYFGSTWLTKL